MIRPSSCNETVCRVRLPSDIFSMLHFLKMKGLQSGAVRWLALPPAFEFVAHLLAGAMEHDPQVALGNVQACADFLVGAFFDGVKLEHLRDARREFAHGPFQMFAELGQFN